MKNKKKLAGQVTLVLGLVLVGATVIYPNEVAGAFAKVTIDTMPPNIVMVKPYPVEVGVQSPLVPDADGNYELYVDIEPLPDDIDFVICGITFPDGTTTDQVVLTYQPNNFQKDYHAMYPHSNFTQSGEYIFNFVAADFNGNFDEMQGIGGLGAPEGDFYINDILVSKDASITLTTRTLSFKFIATKDPDDISDVWINVVGETNPVAQLAKQADGITWDGSSWTAPADGTYQVDGYYSSIYGEAFKALSIFGGINEEPVAPTTLPFPQGAYWTIGIGSAVALIGGLVWYKEYRSPA